MARNVNAGSFPQRMPCGPCVYGGRATETNVQNRTITLPTRIFSMIKKVTHFTVFVKDQDEALKFYTEKLGFKLHTDAAFEGFRWLTIHPAGQPDFEVALMPASPEEQPLIGKQGGKHPLFALESDNCLQDCEMLKKHGVKLHGEPKSEPWGISVAFEDLYGNLLYICEPTIQH